MKFEELFTVDKPRDAVWAFFEEQAETVGRCIPGAQEVEDRGDDHYRVVVTQKVGSVSATFDLKAQIRDKDEPRSMSLSANGRSIKGARGDLRAKATVTLEDDGDGTQVRLEADVALAGMLGSLGHKVIAQKAAEITEQFAATLAKEMAG